MSDKIYGKIMQGVGGLYTVRITDCDFDDTSIIGSTVSCRARGAFRHNNLSPLAGDNVILSYTRNDGKESSEEYVIEEICERKNSLIRPPLANLDYIFITLAAASPKPVLTTVDKLISIAEFNDIEPIIVITKCELDSEYAKKLQAIYEKSGFTVFCLSALQDINIEPLNNFIKNSLSSKLAAFAGASGIGKSTLLNKLFPSLSLSTSEISKKIQRGKHTTRKVELFPVTIEADSKFNGYIADTPGFSMLDFERFDFFEKDDLVYTMREFRPYINKCKYTKCSHTKEDGCAIISALKNGSIAPTRHQSFCELYDVLKVKTKW
jgi:ribosome biogenesis GTPase